MSFFRLASCGLLLAALSVSSSCQKDNPSPTVGDVVVNVDFPVAYNPKSYSLYTEEGYGKGISPLRTGPVTFTGSSATRSKSAVTVTDLNSGNYVFVIGQSSVSVQVTAGRSNSFYYTY